MSRFEVPAHVVKWLVRFSLPLVLSLGVVQPSNAQTACTTPYCTAIPIIPPIPNEFSVEAHFQNRIRQDSSIDFSITSKISNPQCPVPVDKPPTTLTQVTLLHATADSLDIAPSGEQRVAGPISYVLSKEAGLQDTDEPGWVVQPKALGDFLVMLDITLLLDNCPVPIVHYRKSYRITTVTYVAFIELDATQYKTATAFGAMTIFFGGLFTLLNQGSEFAGKINKKQRKSPKTSSSKATKRSR